MRATRWHVEIRKRKAVEVYLYVRSVCCLHRPFIYLLFLQGPKRIYVTCPPGGGAVTVATHTGAISCLYAPKCSEHSLRIVAAAPPTVEEAVPATGRLFSAGPRRLHPSPSLLYRVTSLVRNALVAEAPAARPV